MENIITILTVVLVLILAIFIAYRAQGFMGRTFGKKDKEKTKLKEASSEMINRTSPFNVQADFETSLELSTTIERFQPLEFNTEDETHITLLSRNPYWLYSYWHINHETMNKFKSDYGEESWEDYQLHLELINLTSHKDYLIPISQYADSWYIKVGDTNCHWKVYLGKMVPEVGFIMLAESNVAHTPACSPASVIDPEWEPLDSIWRELLSKGYFTNLFISVYSEELINKRKDD